MDIFNALSDPTRRHILEKLNREGPLSIKQLSEGLPISRQALTKHLNRLIKAKLISADFVGKEKVHQLNPKPLQQLDHWLTPFSERWDSRLHTLQTFLENNDDNEIG